MGRVHVMLADGPRTGTILVLDQHSLVDRFAVPRSIGSDQNPLLPSDPAIDLGDEPHDSHRIVTAEGDEQLDRPAGRASGKPAIREVDAAVLAALVGELKRRRLARWAGRTGCRGPGEHPCAPRVNELKQA